MLEQFLAINNSSESLEEKLDALLSLKEVDVKLKIQLALFCAQESLIFIDKVKYLRLWRKVNVCLVLVRNYLVDETQVSLEALRKAGGQARDAVEADYTAGYTGRASATYATTNVAYAAANATFATYNAANAVTNAIYAAKAAANASWAATFDVTEVNGSDDGDAAIEAAYQKYYNYLVDLILAKHFPDQKSVKLLYF